MLKYYRLDRGTKVFISSNEGWHALRYFLFYLSKIIFQPFGVDELKFAAKESEKPSDSNKPAEKERTADM